MPSSKGYTQRPQGFSTNRLHSNRYELHLTNFLVDSPMLVPKKRAWPGSSRAREEARASSSVLSITMPREENVSSDKSSNERAHDGSDADSESSESEQKVTSPLRKTKAKHTGIIKATKHDKCLKDTGPCLKKKQVVFEDTDTGFMADTSEPELPLKSCLKGKGKKAVKYAEQSDVSEEKSSAPETTEPSTTDGDSTKAVVLSDEDSNVGPATDNDSKPKATTSASGNWSASEDAAIVSMKEGGEIWASIGQAIGRGKKEVQKRWKELSTQQTEGGSTTTGNMTSLTPADTENDADNEMTDAATNKGKGKGGKKSANIPKKTKTSPKKETALMIVSSDSDNEVGSSPDNDVDSEAEIYTRMYSNLNLDDSAALEPDSDFNVQECNVLKVIDVKNKVNHWLEVQADFFNATGRMVPVGVLRRKLEGGQKMASIVEGDED
ncbi:hypothetical protein UCRPA7_1525 [Phaeoacremonium minimum UCRPA7]|uniref:Myb-like domain-containing protein n=1 Tax=Phaeoacremonium minimum (strain UCR-PA7) TaxID=1286976 RepID=R8BUJ8_PHAM7|nr:hypothetical protein UCRPA7_1525 [Phaeoacremonium minimum UCRPA7]EOO02975.1 hypothetical protein UCRPA7_1525 [Phaeoacremonium minimum UCRPA7]